MKPERFVDSSAPLTAVENTILNSIEAQSPVPFYVVDVDDILMKNKSWQLNMPRVKPFYSVRANDTKVVIETLAGLGVGFHCTNRSEIENVLATDISPKEIINGTPLKTNSALRHSWSKGVDLVTVDSEHDLRRIAATNPDARILLKLQVDGTDKIGCKISADRDTCRLLLNHAREMQLKVVGVAFHIASGYKQPAFYPAAIAEAAAVFSMALEFGFEMTILDIGGGFPSTADAVFEDMCSMINNSLDVYFPSVEGSNLSIIAEPGRYFVATAFTLVTRINEESTVDVNNAVISLDDTTLGDFGWSMFDQVVSRSIAVVNENNDINSKPKNNYVSTAFLRSDSYNDECYLKEGLLLSEAEQGEWVVFADMGAYTVAQSSQPELQFCCSEFSLNKLQRVALNWPRIAKILGVDDDNDSGVVVDQRLSSSESRLHRQLSQLIDVN